jgi:hypothetical protein
VDAGTHIQDARHMSYAMYIVGVFFYYDINFTEYLYLMFSICS